MIKKIIYLITMIHFLFSWENNEIEYIIYTKNSLINAAENLSNLYEEIVDDNFKLKTKIIIDDTLSTDLNSYINDNFSYENDNLKYLCIIGDENIISPIYYLGIPVYNFF